MGFESGLATVVRDAATLARYKSPIFLLGGIISKWLFLPEFIPFPLASLDIGALAVNSVFGGRNTSLALLPFTWLCISQDPIEYQSQQYPVASRVQAAIAQMKIPSTIAFRLIIDSPTPSNESTRMANFSALINILRAHTEAGGSFSFITDSYLYEGCILKSVTQMDPDPSQKNMVWRVEFEQPLISGSLIEKAYSSLASAIDGGAI